LALGWTLFSLYVKEPSTSTDNLTDIFPDSRVLSCGAITYSATGGGVSSSSESCDAQDINERQEFLDDLYLDDFLFNRCFQKYEYSDNEKQVTYYRKFLGEGKLQFAAMQGLPPWNQNSARTSIVFKRTFTEIVTPRCVDQEIGNPPLFSAEFESVEPLQETPS
jgi:hypothetical protein